MEPPAAPVQGAEAETPVAEATGETTVQEAEPSQKAVDSEPTPEVGPRKDDSGGGGA